MKKGREAVGTEEKLEELKKKAFRDDVLRERLLQSKDSDNPLRLFCEAARDAGIEIYPMDIVNLGEEMYAAMRRSTNGGGENSPLLKGEDDFYGMFLEELR